MIAIKFKFKTLREQKKGSTLELSLKEREAVLHREEHKELFLLTKSSRLSERLISHHLHLL